MPTRDWLLANNFTVLAAVINEFAGKFGYGPFDTVPAVSASKHDCTSRMRLIGYQVYLLQFFTPDLLAISMGFPGTNALKIGKSSNLWAVCHVINALIDFFNVWSIVAKALSAQINLGVSITGIC